MYISFYSMYALVLSTSRMPYAKLLKILFLITDIDAPSTALIPALLLFDIEIFFSMRVKLAFPAHKIPLSLFFSMSLYLIKLSHLSSFLAIVTIPFSKFYLILFIIIKGSADTTSIPVTHLTISHPFILHLLPLCTLTPGPSILSIFVLSIYCLAPFP